MANKMILVMGLPGSGKTTFAEKLKTEFENCGVIPNWFNADKIREAYQDWDFSEEGRIRAATRMRKLVDNSVYPYSIVDMISPTPETRKLLKPDYVIWMNTINEGRFDDTNKMFIPPTDNEVNLVIPMWEVTDQVAKDVAFSFFGDLRRL